MKSCLKKNLPLLKYLATTKPKERNSIIKKGSPKLIKLICEVCLNTLNGNIPLSQQQKNRLKRHKNVLRKLAKSRLSTDKRKKMMQKGGFLPLLVAPLLANLAVGAVKGIVKGVTGR